MGCDQYTAAAMQNAYQKDNEGRKWWGNEERKEEEGEKEGEKKR